MRAKDEHVLRFEAIVYNTTELGCGRSTDGLRTIAAVSVLRDRIIQPLLAGAGKLKTGKKPKDWSPIDEHYRTLCINMQRLFNDLGIAA